MASLFVYLGLLVAFIGLVSLAKPLRRLRIRTRRAGGATLVSGLVIALLVAMLPAPMQRASGIPTRLDEFAPIYQFNERHATRIQATPADVFRAIKTVTADEIRLLRTLTWIRSPHLGSARESILNLSGGKPIIEVALRSGFLLLAEDPERELVFGTLGGGPPLDVHHPQPQDFINFARPGYAKIAMNFYVEPSADGGCTLKTETRVFATDEGARRGFGVYWRIILPGSALIRTMWLNAIKARAERALGSASLAAAPSPLPLAAAPPKEAVQVSFKSGELELQGYLYRSEGKGPFPAVVFNHGSEKQPGWQPELAKFYTRNGYVFFIPHRHGHGLSPGDYIGDVSDRNREVFDAAAANRRDVELHEIYNRDVTAAVKWLRRQPFVDGTRLVMSGVSYGGIQTVLSAEQGLGVRAFAAFAPAAIVWPRNPEIGKRLLLAVRNAESPISLIQAQNDYSLYPSEVLGKALKEKGAPNQAKVYPPFGTTAQDGHGRFACREAGIAIWGKDVLAFFAEQLKSAK